MRTTMLKTLNTILKYTIIGALAVYIGVTGWNLVIPQTSTVEEYLPEVKSNAVNAKPKYKSIVRLHSNYGFFCSAVTIDPQYALTAAHCVRDSLGNIDTGPIYITDTEGAYTGIVANAVAIDNLRDVAFIKGNFAEFEYAPVDFYGKNVSYGMIMRSCGFPSGEDLYCTDLIHVGNYYFQYRTIGGPIYKGMSGGPVFDIISGKVVGVNSAVSEEHVIISPLIGVLTILGL